jgi:hypothetical protein
VGDARAADLQAKQSDRAHVARASCPWAPAVRGTGILPVTHRQDGDATNAGILPVTHRQDGDATSAGIWSVGTTAGGLRL